MKNVAVIAILDLLGRYDTLSPLTPSVNDYFVKLTTGHKVVMGKNTYDFLVAKLGPLEGQQVLLDRECFVITHKPEEVQFATPISDIGVLNLDLLKDGEVKAFFIGGVASWAPGLQLADECHMAVFDKGFESDSFFDTNYLLDNFTVSEKILSEHEGLAFLTFKRKGQQLEAEV